MYFEELTIGQQFTWCNWRNHQRELCVKLDYTVVVNLKPQFVCPADRFKVNTIVLSGPEKGQFRWMDHHDVTSPVDTNEPDQQGVHAELRPANESRRSMFEFED